MKKESKFSKLFRRDEIFRNTIFIAGFVIFVVSTLFWPITIGGELLNKEVTFIEVKYSLKMIGVNFIFFLFILFNLLISKKKHFNEKAALVITNIGSLYIGIRLYLEKLEPFWLFLSSWIFLTLIIFIVVKFIFKQLSESLLE